MLDRFLIPTVALGATAIVVHLSAGFAPRVDVNCKGVLTIPACGSEKDVPDTAPRAAFTLTFETSVATNFQYVAFDTTTDEERVAPSPLTFMLYEGKV